MSHATPARFSFRPARLEGEGNDLSFLRALYAGTRQDELAVTGWPQEQIDAFLDQQFEAQHRHYMQHYRMASFDVIVGPQGDPIGRLYLDEGPDEFRVIDIALVPEARGRGIGGRIMQQLLDRAFATGRVVRIHVEKNNPALRLYRRLGFRPVEDRGVYHLMEARPEGHMREDVA